MNPQEYNLNTSEEQIIAACQKIKQVPQSDEGRHLDLNYLTNLLSLKYQKKILDGQNKFNKDILNQNKWLVYGTWALVLANVLLILYK